MTTPARLTVMCLQMSLRALVCGTGVRAHSTAVLEGLGSGRGPLGPQTGDWQLPGNTSSRGRIFDSSESNLEMQPCVITVYCNEKMT